MNVLAMFPSKYLKAADLGDRTHDVTIESVTVGVVGEGDDESERPIVMFREMGKGLCLNVTNAKRIIKLYGQDTDDWINKRVTIYPSECDFRGETVPCIRVKPNAPAASVEKSPAKKPVAAKGKR